MKPIHISFSVSVLAGFGACFLPAQGLPPVEVRVTTLEQRVASLMQQVTSQGQQITTLAQRVTSLENGWQPPPADLTVNCAAGQTVTAALAQAARTAPVTITVQGVCTEGVIIERDDVTIRGAAPGAGLQAPSPSSIILNLGGRRIRLEQLTLTGGSGAIHANSGAFFWASNLHVTGAGDKGITVASNATGELRNSTVENRRVGISAYGGNLTVNGGLIRNSAGVGISAAQGGTVWLGDGVVVQDSGVFGVAAGSGAQVAIVWATVERSGGSGVHAESGASIRIDSGSLIQASGGTGVHAFGGTVALYGRVAGTNGVGVRVGVGGNAYFGGAVIENNQGAGVAVGAASATWVSNGTVIRGNRGDGIRVRDTSAAAFFDGNNQIINNQGWGIFCDGTPSVAQIQGAIGTVSGNTAGENNCPGAPAR